MPVYEIELPAYYAEPEVTPTAQVDEDSGETIDHAAAAVDRLVQQFKGKPKIEAFIRAFCAPMAALEQAFVDLIVSSNARHVDTAEDDQLQMLARFVGQVVLDGLSNDDLRRYVRARIAANKSCGTGPDIIKITRLVVNDEDTIIHVRTVGNATANVRLENNPTDFDLSTILYRDFLSKAVGVGVRIQLEWETDDPAEMFEFETFSGPTGPGKGWGDTSDSDTGGKMASAI